MLVSDFNKRKIYVYDLYGKFKRSFEHKSKYMCYNAIFNYNNDNLICYDKYNNEIAFVLVSKQDGRITKEIKIPFKEKKFLSQIQRISEDNYVIPADIQVPAGSIITGMGRSQAPSGANRPIIPYNDNWILLEFSSDTIYTLLPDNSLRPFIARTPSIHSMDTEIMLILRLISDRYYFMESIRNEYNYDKNTGFSRDFFMYDKQERSFSRYTVYNGDYSIKKEIYMVGFTPVNNEIEAWYPIEAYQLVESYKKGELKEGKLKEIASKLDEEDNPVIMLVKHKK